MPEYTKFDIIFGKFVYAELQTPLLPRNLSHSPPLHPPQWLRIEDDEHNFVFDHILNIFLVRFPNPLAPWVSESENLTRTFLAHFDLQLQFQMRLRSSSLTNAGLLFLSFFSTLLVLKRLHPEHSQITAGPIREVRRVEGFDLQRGDLVLELAKVIWISSGFEIMRNSRF